MLYIDPLFYNFNLYLNTSDIFSLYILSKCYRNKFKQIIQNLCNDININIIYYKNEPFYIKYIIFGKGLFWYSKFIYKKCLKYDPKNNYYYKIYNFVNYDDSSLYLPTNNIKYIYS